LTVTKLRWLADHEPEHADRIAAVALPHDWLTWRLSGATGLETLVTDRSDASGTGYFDASSGSYRRDLLARALRRTERAAESVVLPKVLAASESAGYGDPSAGLGHLLLGAGCGDNAAAALALGLRPGRTSISLGTSGVVSVVSDRPIRDPTGQVAGFADATGQHLGLAVTLNAARVLDAAAAVLGVDHEELARLALAAAPGSGGLIHVPFLDGERTPNLPHATGSLLGMTTTSLTRENYARAAVEGLLCLMADGIAAVAKLGVDVDSVVMVGGAARSAAVQQIAPQVLCLPVDVAPASEYVADGAARQAAWVLRGGMRPRTGQRVPPEPSPGRLFPTSSIATATQPLASSHRPPMDDHAATRRRSR
jgi:xylulokinase